MLIAIGQLVAMSVSSEMNLGDYCLIAVMSSTGMIHIYASASALMQHRHLSFLYAYIHIDT